MKYFFLLLVLTPVLSKSQIVNFKQKVETANYITYKDVKLHDVVVKGDSIFGINKDVGKLFVSFDKGLNFNNVETNKICDNCNFHSNTEKIFGVGFFFLKGDDIILYKNSKFYKSIDWINFKPVNTITKTDLPIIVQRIQKEDPNYWFLNCFYENDTYFMTFSGADGQNYKNYYSQDLISWKEISKPNNLSIASYEGIKYYNKSLFLFTWDNKNKSLAYYTNDLGKSWIELTGLHYKYAEGFTQGSLKNTIIFNNKIYYENIYDSFIYDIKKQTTTSIHSTYPYIKNPKIKNDYLYFTLNNKIWTYKNDSISELKIDYSKLKNIDDALLTDKYIVINGDKLLLTSNLSETEKNKYLNVNRETKYLEVENHRTTKYQYVNKYDLLVYADDLKNYKYNIKRFESTISNNLSILSLTFGFPSNGFMSSYGNHLFSTNKNNGYSNHSFDNLMSYYREKKIGVFNGNQVKNNTVYFTYNGKDRIEINELTLIDNNVKPINKRYYLPYEFELKNNQNIETYKLNGLTVGNEISAFLGMSQYSLKTYLFIYDYKKSTNSNYRKIDLTKVTSLIDNTIGKAGKHICLNFKGTKEGTSLNSNIYSISSIIQNENFIYIFLASEYLDWVLPVCIDKSNYSVNLKNNSLFNIGNFEYNRTMNMATNTGGYSYLPFSKEFINHYKQENNNKLVIYNKNMDKTWSTIVNDIDIKHINELENYLIIGGSTKNSGYRGFANPKVIVIDRVTRKICYSKVILKKYASVQSVKLDSDRNVIFSIGTSDVIDPSFNPLIIIDKLDKNGKFVNDLFTN